MIRSVPGALVRALVRRPGRALAIAGALAALSIVPASRLRLEVDLASLLPRGSPAAAGYRTFLETFGGAETVFAIVVAEPGRDVAPESLAEAAQLLAEALDQVPEVVSDARAGLTDEDEAFFAEQVAPRLPLLLGADAAQVLGRAVRPEAIAARVAELRAAASTPWGIGLAPLITADPLGLAQPLLASLASAGTAELDPLTGAFLSLDRTAALVVVEPRRAEIDPQAGRELQAVLDRTEHELRAADLPVRVHAVGGPLYALHDEAALRRDLVRTLVVATVVVGLLILLAFDGLAIPLAAVLAILAGQLWTAALIALGFGSVTAMGVGLAAILVGLGDDYVIHMAARFRELWLDGQRGSAAMEHAVSQTGPGILSAALTTAAGFGVLAFGHFRPLAELGTFVALGVLVVLVASLLVAAPVLALASRRWRRHSPRRVWTAIGGGIEALVRTGAAHRRTVIAAALVLIALALVGVGRLRLEVDLRRFRPDDHPARAVERMLVTKFALGLDTTTLVVRAPTLAGALDRAAAVRQIVAERVPAGSEVRSPSDWLVTGERQRTRLQSLSTLGLDRAADRLERELDHAGFDPRAFASSLDGLRALARGEDPLGSPDPGAAPSWLRRWVHTGASGTSVAIHLRLPSGTWAGGPPREVVRRVEQTAPGTLWASVPALGADMRDLAVQDLARLGAIALAVVGGIVLVSFRGSLRRSALSLVPVLAGTTCTFGLWGFAGLPVDLFAVSVLPIMLGIGLDDGLHVLHTAGSVPEAALAAGRGVVLTNLTTSAGFGSLVLSDVPALRNGGALVCVGNMVCLLATLLLLPALASHEVVEGEPSSR